MKYNVYTIFSLLFITFILSSCSHFKANMIYDAYFPATARVNQSIEWYVVTSMRADSVVWNIYLTHGPLSGNLKEYYIGGIKPTELWKVDMFPVKGFKHTIPELELLGHYKIYLRVWNRWFEDKIIFNMEIRQDELYESPHFPPVQPRPGFYDQV